MAPRPLKMKNKKETRSNINETKPKEGGRQPLELEAGDNPGLRGLV
jgi:hypothetical protein